MSYCVNKK